jgi:hypothetical protein
MFLGSVCTVFAVFTFVQLVVVWAAMLCAQCMQARTPVVPLEAVEGNGKTCPICLETMRGRGCSRLPCEHVYHTECVQKWWERHASCPYCRMSVRTDAEEWDDVPAAPYAWMGARVLM